MFVLLNFLGEVCLITALVEILIEEMRYTCIGNVTSCICEL